MEIPGKVVVVTGASMGIGEALARAFLDRGASVVLLSRDAARAEAARQRAGHPERSLALACDVRDRAALEQAAAQAVTRFGRLDVWINNAGYGLEDSVAEVDSAAARDLFDTNFFGALYGMQAAIAIMKSRRDGVIINISSVGGHIPLPFHALYSATKFAMNAIGKAARVELRPYGIHVMTVCPGYVQTRFSEHAVKRRTSTTVNPSTIRGIGVDRVARAVIRGYRSQRREVIVPWSMQWVVRLYQHFPALVEWAMARTLKARARK